MTIVESALLFETKHGGEGGWQKRFDRIIFVQATEERKIARFVARTSSGRTLSSEERAALEADARQTARTTGRRRTECSALRLSY